ncbi:MAG: Nif3-like dinuclear metal center hexameric protein [Candidatus Bipolaricaulota bacterium]|nr:Nif3-like dinuclear metal center hexameric protein [Candidatus Bipolaricaulota bacterium]
MLRQDVVAFLDERFPPALAEPWDRSGLQVGPLSAPCRRVTVALDLSLPLASGLDGVDLVVTHHPLLFRPLERVLPETPSGAKLKALLSAGTALYAVHTPYDVAHGGLGEVLAALLSLTDVRPLAPRGRLLKLVVFVPQGHEDAVAHALFRAGAGGIGNYTHCSFRAPGTGTFLPGAGARPFLGEVGREERAPEVRLETVVPGERVPAVLRAMKDAHPYEEVAYDLYPLEIPPGRHGLGRVGELPEPMRATEVVSAFGEGLRAEPRAVYGDLDRTVRRVAVCGGSGGSLVGEALAAGAELYLTGELGYHDGLGAAEGGLAAVAFGHRETEAPFVGHVARLLRERFPTLEVEER